MANMLKFCRSVYGITSNIAGITKYAVHNISRNSTFPIFNISQFSTAFNTFKPNFSIMNNLLKPTNTCNQIQQQRNYRRKFEYKTFSEDVQLYLIHKAEPKKIHKRKHPLDSRPQMKGVVLKTLVKKPKKPNSANRKCVLVRLSNGKEAVAYVPGEGHNLQEHNTVLVRFGRVKDVPGLRLKVIRGKYDCGHVVKKGSTVRI
ncbi:40S ribosomal protein S12, mitochondrial-like [Argiope bruennichi]|uniref:Small ribosomal subunit protein uS12m n=1 Tax=Argiope bruennichi TaxID=94029 RepID=A0A8T0E1P9_ARGBR|nr:40S ribosomal protein S12, mitochondrial-like [Argiope bruennichi]KAF8764286.1 28S ribosomal protein S12 like protein [Argiope bruennichi]